MGWGVSHSETADRLGVSWSDRWRWVAIPHGVLPPRLRLVGVGLSRCGQRAFRQGRSIGARLLPNSFGLVVLVLVVPMLAGLTLD
jgi:hypothetical protein